MKLKGNFLISSFHSAHLAIYNYLSNGVLTLEIHLHVVVSEINFTILEVNHHQSITLWF